MLYFVLMTGIVAMAKETRLLRQPDISETQIVFAYANDNWMIVRPGA